MFVTAAMLAKEIGCTPRTIADHVRKMERDGYHIRARIGRPAQINREMFLEYVYGKDWEDAHGIGNLQS